MIAKQNKWHAVRYGMDASLVDFDTMLAVPARQACRRVIEHCAPYAERLGCLEQLRYVDEILEQGTGASRQRRVFNETGDPREVVRYMIEQSSVTQPAPAASEP